ncbi:hypothetical protein [Streptomyces sp. NPDC048521]|uniref:hypothetical protein n=1 Tax=Streptomyces sp. NPDC048521 TaxID=3365566 RepID=UPI0037239092
MSGGVVAVGLAAAWQALGFPGNPLARGESSPRRTEPFAGELVAEGLRGAGVDVRPDTEVAPVRRENGGDGPVRGSPWPTGRSRPRTRFCSPPAARRVRRTSA